MLAEAEGAHLPNETQIRNKNQYQIEITVDELWLKSVVIVRGQEKDGH